MEGLSSESCENLLGNQRLDAGVDVIADRPYVFDSRACTKVDSVFAP
jgi:hypothetical protein